MQIFDCRYPEAPLTPRGSGYVRAWRDEAAAAIRRIPRRLLLAAVIAAAPAICQAQTILPGYPDDVFLADAREMAMVPRYCIYSPLFRDTVPGGANPEEIKRWSTVLGPTFQHIHHYCAGLIKTNRAVILLRTGQHRKFYLQDAITEFDYVLRSAPADFVLLPEILTKKGENLFRLGQGGRAEQELRRAIELKPDYWPPYAALGDYYRKKGNTAKAREILQTGLSMSPGAKALKSRLGALDRAPGRNGQAQSESRTSR